MTPAPPKRTELPATERILLLALLASERVRQEILPRLRPELTQGFVSHEIFEAFRNIAGESPERLFGALEGRLSDSARALLHDAVATDHTDEGEQEELAWVQAVACLERLETDERKRLIADLKTRVRVAEREGRIQEALQLMEEVRRLEEEERGYRQRRKAES